MSYARFHNVVKIIPEVVEFDTFTVYAWVAVDKKGHKFRVEFFHTHKDGSLVIEPTKTVDEKEKV